MKPSSVKKALIKQIIDVAAHPQEYCRNPEIDFSRRRMLSFQETIEIILSFSGKSITNELLDRFDFNPQTISSSAFVQQRGKILPSAFEAIFKKFTATAEILNNVKLYKGYRLFAVDGSDIHIPTNRDDTDSFFSGTNGQKPYNLLHLNALYDILNKTYADILIQKNLNCNEHKALIQMIESSSLMPSIVIADRGYESYNTMAHIQEAGWFYLVRVKNSSGVVRGLDLPPLDEFDIDINMNMTRSYSNKIKELCKNRNHYRFVPVNSTFDYLPILNGKRRTEPVFYSLTYRIVRVRVSEELVETLVTNLPRDRFSPAEIKKMYSMRWGIETSFRNLKYTVGLLHFHSKKTDSVLQEIYAAVIMYNFTEIVTACVVIKNGQRKHTYRVNFSVAVHVCKYFLKKKLHPPNVEALITKYIVPIREERQFVRIVSGVKVSTSFTYRVA